MIKQAEEHDILVIEEILFISHYSYNEAKRS